MEWTITIIAICVAAGATAFAAWTSGRPHKDSVRPQWMSWRLATVFAGAMLLFGLVHAVNLAGIKTGRDGPGVSSYP
jgi:amino acid transporter